MEWKNIAISLILIGLVIFIITQPTLLMDWKVATACFGFLVLGFSLGLNRNKNKEKTE